MDATMTAKILFPPLTFSRAMANALIEDTKRTKNVTEVEMSRLFKSHWANGASSEYFRVRVKFSSVQ